MVSIEKLRVSPPELLFLLSALMGRGASQPTVRRSVAAAWRTGGTAGDALGRLKVERGLEVPSASEVTREAREIDRLGLKVIDLRDESYPPLLAATPDPPLALFLQGERTALCPAMSLAIVGSRRSSLSGREAARSLAFDLGCAGFAIISGLAAGIDGSAHRGALEAGAVTVAVMGGGHGRIYPSTNYGLAREIVAAAGALVSEYPPSVAPLKGHFPERNRIISGISAAVVVVEATVRSGSLITARMALEQGRDVLAVPGPVHGGRNGGCHRLIKQGAALVENALDVLEALGLEAPPSGDAATSAPSNPFLARVLAAVSVQVTQLQDIVESSGMPLEDVLGALVELELEGFVETYRDGYIRRPLTTRDTS